MSQIKIYYIGKKWTKKSNGNSLTPNKYSKNRPEEETGTKMNQRDDLVESKYELNDHENTKHE